MDHGGSLGGGGILGQTAATTGNAGGGGGRGNTSSWNGNGTAVGGGDAAPSTTRTNASYQAFAG